MHKRKIYKVILECFFSSHDHIWPPNWTFMLLKYGHIIVNSFWARHQISPYIRHVFWCWYFTTNLTTYHLKHKRPVKKKRQYKTCTFLWNIQSSRLHEQVASLTHACYIIGWNSCHMHEHVAMVIHTHNIHGKTLNT